MYLQLLGKSIAWNALANARDSNCRGVETKKLLAPLQKNPTHSSKGGLFCTISHYMCSAGKGILWLPIMALWGFN